VAGYRRARSKTNRVTGKYQVVGQVSSAREVALTIDQAPRKILTQPNRNAQRELLLPDSNGHSGIQIECVSGAPETIIAPADYVTKRDTVNA
jgi:hypothetical protein